MDVSVGALRASQQFAAEPWYVVQHKPNGEALAIRNLERQSITIFAPHEMGMRRFGTQQRIVRKPLFPGYLFVHFNPGEVRWRAVNSTFGVSRIVSFGTDHPVCVPPDLMRGLMERCDFSGCLLPPTEFQPGEPVQIKSGPFAQFIGTVESMAPQQRVWLLLEFLGRATRVAVDRADLRKMAG